MNYPLEFVRRPRREPRCDLPDLNGYEALRQLKADPATAQIPVVILTIRGLEEDRQRGMALGAADYLVKPFDPLQLPGRLLAIVKR